MSKLRIQADLILPDDGAGEAEALYAQLEALVPKLQLIAPMVGRTERSRIELHRCHHDEPDPTACEVLASWESP